MSEPITAGAAVDALEWYRERCSELLHGLGHKDINMVTNVIRTLSNDGGRLAERVIVSTAIAENTAPKTEGGIRPPETHISHDMWVALSHHIPMDWTETMRDHIRKGVESMLLVHHAEHVARTTLFSPPVSYYSPWTPLKTGDDAIDFVRNHAAPMVSEFMINELSSSWRDRRLSGMAPVPVVIELSPPVVLTDAKNSYSLLICREPSKHWLDSPIYVSCLKIHPDTRQFVGAEDFPVELLRSQLSAEEQILGRRQTS